MNTRSHPALTFIIYILYIYILIHARESHFRISLLLSVFDLGAAWQEQVAFMLYHSKLAPRYQEITYYRKQHQSWGWAGGRLGRRNKI
jgi:hypothetical protein